jgi:hypothetical protein
MSGNDKPRKRNSGDTKGYPEENPGRHPPQSGKDTPRKKAEDVGVKKSDKPARR